MVPTCMLLMAGVTGLEPATSGLTGQRSNQLSYTPMWDKRTRFYRAPARMSTLWGSICCMEGEHFTPEMSGPPEKVAGVARRGLDSALKDRDRAAAVRIALGAVLDGAISVPDLYTLVLGPLMTDTGAAWQRGATCVWEEHYATATVRTIVEALAPHVIEALTRVTARGETVLLACPPEEYHDLGLRMMLDRFLLAGYNAHFLGADLPVSEICEAAERLGADLVVLSASTHYHRVRLRETIERLQAGVPAGTRIVVGGPAFAHDPEAFGDLVVDPAALGLPGFEPREDG